MDGTITGAWISPDRTRITMQVDDEILLQFDVRGAHHAVLSEVDIVAHDWEALVTQSEDWST